MYLSRVKIDVNNRQKIQNLSHLGAYHDWVEKCFPSEIGKHIRTRKLWRVDTVNNEDYLMLVSPDRPDTSRLERYGVPGTAQTIDYGKALDNLKEGMKLRFKAVLCPEFGHRPCRTHRSMLEYFIKRSDKNGFSLKMPGTIGDNVILTGRVEKELCKKHHYLTNIHQATYEGYLVITDVDKFKYMLCHGLGRKRSYGCGLVTVMR